MYRQKWLHHPGLKGTENVQNAKWLLGSHPFEKASWNRYSEGVNSPDLFRRGKERDGQGRRFLKVELWRTVCPWEQNGGQIWEHSFLPVSGNLATFTQLDFKIFRVQRVLHASHPCLSEWECCLMQLSCPCHYCNFPVLTITCRVGLVKYKYLVFLVHKSLNQNVTHLKSLI